MQDHSAFGIRIFSCYEMSKFNTYKRPQLQLDLEDLMQYKTSEKEASRKLLLVISNKSVLQINT